MGRLGLQEDRGIWYGKKDQCDEGNGKSAAFAIMREEGMDGLTARRLADKTGCSTQPIFRIYENMNELHEEAFAMAIAYYTDFTGHL